MSEVYYQEVTTVEDVVNYVDQKVKDRADMKMVRIFWDITWLSYDEHVSHPMFNVFKSHCELLQQMQSSMQGGVSKEKAALYQGLVDIVYDMKEKVDQERERYGLKEEQSDDADKLELFILVSTFLGYYAHLYSYYEDTSSSMKLAVN